MKEAAKYIAGLAFFAIWTVAVFSAATWYERAKPEPFPSIRKWQVKIDAEPDGKLGPKTEAAWHNRYYEINGYLMY